MTAAFIGHIHRRILPFTLTARLLTLTTAPSLAALLPLNRVYAVPTAQVVMEKFSEDDFLKATNDARIAAGIAPLTLSKTLSSAAAAKALDMQLNGYWAHYRPTDHKAPWDFMHENGYNYTVAGENLAKGFTSVRGITDAWMASPTHRANLLSDKYTEVGFADLQVKQADGSTELFTVQMFGAR